MKNKTLLRTNSISLLLTIAIIMVSCDNKKPINSQLDIAYISKPNSCTGESLPQDIKDIYEPFELNTDGAVIFSGTIYRHDLNPQVLINISSVKNDIQNNLQQSILNIKEKPMGQINQDYKNAIEDVKLNNFCQESNNPNATQLLIDTIAKKRYSEILVFSKTIKDSVWLSNYRVYKDISAIRKRLSEIYKSSINQKILVIMEPVDNNVVEPPPPPKGGGGDTTTRFFDNKQIEQILLQINMLSKVEYIERTTKLNKIADSLFADKFTIKCSFGEANSSFDKSYSNGRDYLDQLASNKHLNNIKVNAFKSKAGKITQINVTEIQKKTIIIQSK